MSIFVTSSDLSAVLVFSNSENTDDVHDFVVKAMGERVVFSADIPSDEGAWLLINFGLLANVTISSQDPRVATNGTQFEITKPFVEIQLPA